ncbi:hypothetical protein ONZ45_g6680 [Pleurotus djamor]|nr:hypothetical protein ONZ45_g6680 [Pleurotus djamor]
MDTRAFWYMWIVYDDLAVESVADHRFNIACVGMDLETAKVFGDVVKQNWREWLKELDLEPISCGDIGHFITSMKVYQDIEVVWYLRWDVNRDVLVFVGACGRHVNDKVNLGLLFDYMRAVCTDDELTKDAEAYEVLTVMKRNVRSGDEYRLEDGATRESCYGVASFKCGKSKLNESRLLQLVSVDVVSLLSAGDTSQVMPNRIADIRSGERPFYEFTVRYYFKFCRASQQLYLVLVEGKPSGGGWDGLVAKYVAGCAQVRALGEKVDAITEFRSVSTLRRMRGPPQLVDLTVSNEERVSEDDGTHIECRAWVEGPGKCDDPIVVD